MFHSLNCFGHVIYIPQISTYQNILKLSTHPSNNNQTILWHNISILNLNFRFYKLVRKEKKYQQAKCILKILSLVISIRELKYISFSTTTNFKLPPKVSCEANSVWSNSVWFCTRSTNITPQFKVHVTSAHPHKSNMYAYENQTRDQQNIPANFKTPTQNTNKGQLDKSCRFCLQEEEGIKIKE